MSAKPQDERGGSAPADDLWTKCPSCKEIAFRKEVERNLNVCPKCSHHQALTVEQRLAITLDRGSWRELFRELTAGDPLKFVDSKPYLERLKQARIQTGGNEAVTVGTGRIGGRRVALGVMDFSFMGGSMGLVVGEKIGRLFDCARERRIPVIIFSSSGGARMQEGALSLMQMAKVAAAIGRLRDARIPYISVACDPTTGGVAASFASLGDVNLSEPGALIGFAGRRVAGQGTNQQLPENFQRAEFVLAHGMLDAIVPRDQMRHALGALLKLLGSSRNSIGSKRVASRRRRTPAG
jgi:acetyl-CoA carboxylase carboxyl transferase subunit beta